jgi:hypothetical protein
MGQKEMLRGRLLEMVKQGKTTLKAAVVQLNISYRQGDTPPEISGARRCWAAARFNGETVEAEDGGGHPRTGD